jgi:hypothetical protein
MLTREGSVLIVAGSGEAVAEARKTLAAKTIAAGIPWDESQWGEFTVKIDPELDPETVFIGYESDYLRFKETGAWPDRGTAGIAVVTEDKGLRETLREAVNSEIRYQTQKISN